MTPSPTVHIITTMWIICMVFAAGVPVPPSHAAPQQYQYASGCSDCHRMPPIDAPYRNVTTGGFKGSHATHNPPSEAGQPSCEKCHHDSSTYDTWHMNDFINMTSNINSSPHPSRSAYNKPRFFNQTSNPVMQTCSNVNCHFETITPAWSSTQFSSPANCNGCHGAPPADGSHPATGGSGKKHGDYYTTTTASCGKCHPDHTAEASPFAHATSAGHRGLTIMFTTNLNGGFGRYTGNISYPYYLPSQSPSRNGTCRTTYCHSPGNKSSSFDPPNASAIWGGSLDCKGCHKADIASGSYMTTGSHKEHVNKFGGQYNVIKCYKCHAATASAALTVTEPARHVNGQVEIAFSNSSSAAAGSYKGILATPASPMAKAPGSTYGACSTVYCHSTGQGAGGSWPPTYRTPTWGISSSGYCGTCHGNQFNHVFGTTTPITTGSHTRHLSYTLNVNYRDYERCVACHAYKRDGFDPNNCNQGMCHAPTFAKHANYEINVNMPLYFGADASYSGSSTPGDGYGSCSSTYCHSNGTSVATGSVPANTSADWGAGTLPCSSCHGNGTYSSDFRKGAPLYTSGSPKGNAHISHIRAGSLTGVYMQCHSCHAATTRTSTTITGTSNHVNKAYNVAASVLGQFSSIYWDGDNSMYLNKVTLSYNYSPAGSSCSNVSCHPIGLDITTSPPTQKTRSTSSVAWNRTATCIDCHNIDMQSTSTFHHAMRNYSSGYPLQSPSGSADSGTNVHARRCTMCHVDHNIFSDDLNSSNSMGRAGNLRTDIAVEPTVSSGYTNTDYLKASGGTGGICLSCHSAARTKDMTRRRNDSPATVTPVITQAQYSSSGHQYDVPALFMSDNSTVYGNCSKCHNALLNETSIFMNATSPYQFGNHNSGIRRLQGSLGAAGGETAEEQICYRCHSLATDADPGGGPPKRVAEKDFYGVAPMSLAAEDIFGANADFRPASAYSSTNTLYFRPAAAENPAEAMPNQHNTGDTFAGGTWIGRSMSPWESTTAYETKSQGTNTIGISYWRMATFTSPKVYSTTTVPAGSWVISLYCRESSSYQNARIRYMVYKWNDPADTMGSTVIARGTYSTELATTSAPGSIRQIAISVGATTLSAGEKIVVDLSLETSASSSTGYTASFYFGSHAPSSLALPGKVNWSYADPGVSGFGHRTHYYSGIHLPSPQNETLAYIALNRHVECVDCHNPHATRNGLHGDYGIATGGSTTTLVNSNKHWVANQFTGAYINIISGTGAGQTRVITSNTATTATVPTWTAPTAGSVYRIITNTNVVSRSQRGVTGASVSYSGAWTRGTFAMVNEATYEYEICFKCHAVTDATYNSVRYWNVTSPALGAARWTDIGLEFNPNNISYHPVVAPLPESGNRRLSTAALTGGWAPGLVMSCSDCHGRDTGNSATAQGPHGSTVKWMLTGTYQNWPFTSAAANGTETGGTLLTGTGTSTVPANNFCFNCHTWAAGGFAHTKSATGHGLACLDCHIRVPHGGKVPRLLTGPNAPSRYKPNGNGGGFGSRYLTSAQLPATGYMGLADVSCNSVSCGKHATSPTKTHAW